MALTKYYYICRYIVKYHAKYIHKCIYKSSYFIQFLYIFYKMLIMSNIEVLEKIKLLCETHNITAYEIGKHTKLSTFAIQRILSGETKTPTKNSLKIIIDFIEGRLNEEPLKVAEERSQYSNGQRIEDIIAEKVLLKLQPTLERIEQAIAENIIDVDDIKEMITKATQKSNKGL